MVLCGYLVGLPLLLILSTQPPLPLLLLLPLLQAAAVFSHLRAQFAPTTAATTITAVPLAPLVGQLIGGGTLVVVADEFTYVDPIDGSVSKNQVRGRRRRISDTALVLLLLLL